MELTPTPISNMNTTLLLTNYGVNSSLHKPPALTKQLVAPAIVNGKHVKDRLDIMSANRSFNFTDFLADWSERDWSLAPNFIPPYWQFIHPYVATSLLVFTSAVGVACNLLLCCVILRRKPLRTSVNMMIVNLAAVSLVHLTLGVPAVLVHDILFPLIHLSLRSAMCKFFPYILHVSFYVTSYSIVSLCTMHFLMTWSSDCVTRYTTSPRQGIIASTIVWILSLSGNIPILIGYDVSGEDSYAQCYHTEIAANRVKRKLWVMTHFTFGCGLPACVALILCALLLHDALKSDSSEYSRITKRRSSCKGTFKPITAVFILSLFYVISWLPFQVLVIVDVMSSPGQMTYVFDVVMEVCMCLANMFPAIAPIICLVFPGTVRHGIEEQISEQKETERMLHRSVLLKEGVAITKI